MMASTSRLAASLSSRLYGECKQAMHTSVFMQQQVMVQHHVGHIQIAVACTQPDDCSLTAATSGECQTHAMDLQL